MKALVSVCIPAYNNADYIAETIEAVLKQSYDNLELVICDDQSKDRTVEVIESFHDDRIKLYKNEKNLGMSGNWNHCLSKCQGTYIKLLCADDVIREDALEKEVAALEANPEAIFVSSDTRLFDLDGKAKGWYRRYKKSGLVDGKEIIRKGFFNQNFFGAPLANTIRRSAIEAYGGFDPEFVYILDYELWVRLASHGSVYIIHEPLNYFRVRNDSNTGTVMSGEKSKIYVAEHRKLVTKHREVVHMSDFEIELSVLIRRLRSFAASIYLKLFVRR